MELQAGHTSSANLGNDEHAADAAPVNDIEARRASSIPAAPVVIPPNASRISSADGAVQLPHGTRLDAIKLSGKDLVITLPDGQVLVVVDGALHIPQIRIGTIRIPATNVAALIAKQEPEPAAGAPQSSGGNFEQAPGDIGDAFALGDLLAPTEFGFARQEEKSFIPAVVDNEPEILIVTPDQPSGSTAATATVSEAALPPRGAEPAGSDPTSASETVNGTIRITSLDQPSVVSVNGTAITAIGQTVATKLGVMTITGISPGIIDYSYTLSDNSTDPAASDIVNITVTDGDGDVATATLTLTIGDDAPTARVDIDNLAGNVFAGQSGNVITGTGTTSGAAGSDTLGADGASVTGIRTGSGAIFAPPGVSIAGQYGVLLIKADGSYVYTRSPNTPGGVADIFTYRLTDGDGDVSTATLTFNIGDSAVELLVPSAGDDGTFVNEAGLSERDNEPAGSRNGDDSTITVGIIAFEAPDGTPTITINGVLITGEGQEIELATGVFVVMAINRDSLEYAFALTDNTLGAETSQPIEVTVTDKDGDSATSSFAIDILDDSPSAVSDVEHIAAASYEVATGNVITDAEQDGGRDIVGADGAAVWSVAAASGSVTAGTPIAGLHGVLTLTANGGYRYQRNPGSAGGQSDTFTYVLKDGDGSTSTATLTIVIADSGVTLTLPDGTGDGQNVSEAGLPGGSDPSSGSATTVGSFGYSIVDGPGSVSINGTDVSAVGQTIVGSFGALTITSIGAGEIGYSYMLAGASDGDDNIDEFYVRVADRDGDTATGNLRIFISDDAPAAADEVDAVDAGMSAGADGNVLTGFGGTDGNASDGELDVQGADTAQVIAVSFDGGEGNVGGETQGRYGILTIAADGSYLYALDNDNAEVLGLNGEESLTETFSYVLIDGDGDESSATLTVTIRGRNDVVTISGLNAGGAELSVSEANLPSGSAPDNDLLTRTGSFMFEGADGISGITLGGQLLFDGDIIPDLTIVTDNGVLTITGFDGVFDGDGQLVGGTVQYSYELTANSLLHSGANAANLTESFQISITDTDGSVAQSSLDVLIVDDSPAARAAIAIAVAEDAPLIVGNLLEDDSQGADGAVLTSVTIGGETVSVSVSGTTTYSNANGTYTFEFDGTWTFDPKAVPSASPVNAGFAYTITDGDGDASTSQQQIQLLDGANPTAGAPVNLLLDDQQLFHGSTPSLVQPLSASGQIQFTQRSDAITAIVFGDTSALGGGLRWVRETDRQITGWDGDQIVMTLDLTVSGTTATVKATLESNYAHHADTTTDDLANLGAARVIAIDSDGDTATGTVNLSVSDDVPTISVIAPAAGLLVVDESNLALNATANFASLFNVVMGADVPVAVTYSFDVTTSSGLFDIATGARIILQSLGNVVEGRLAGSPSILAFRLSIAADGQATLDQMRAVQHANATNPDDAASPSSTIIRLYATVTDGDGDHATAIAFVGNALVFRDDGPSIDAAAVDTNSIVLATQDGDTRGAALDIATADLTSVFTVAATAFGADGPQGAGQVSWSYALALGAGATFTGLFSNGVAVTLALVNGEVVGTAGGDPVFSIAVNALSGIVTLTQFAEIDHPLPGSGSDYAAQFVELAANLIELRGTATIIDRDGDSASDVVAVDLGGNIRFADDGPSISAGGALPELVVDETNLYTNATADLAGLFAVDFGPDGSGRVVYELGVTAGPSGLVDSLTGEEIMLSITGGVVYGRTSTHEAFRISLSSDANVVFDQSRAIMHSPDTGPDQIRYLLGTNLITLSATATDGDGDTAHFTADITGRFAILDDAPAAANDEDNVARDGQMFADGNVLTALGGLDDNGTDGAPDNPGADGLLHVVGVAFGTVAGTPGSALAGEYGSLTLGADGSYRYELDISDAAVIALGAGQILSETFSYTVADGDGDTSAATITITITGANDFPIARADTNWVLDGLSGTDPSTSGNVLQDIAHPGAPAGSFADVADNDPDLEPLTVTSAGTYVGLYGTLVMGSNGAYTYTLNEDNAAVSALGLNQTLVDSFAYTLSDGQLSVASSLSITIFGTNDAPTIGAAVARISEEGLLGGVADTAPDATLDTTNSVTVGGVLAIGDLDAGETLTATLGDPGGVLTSGGVPVTWTGVGTGTLIGSAGSSEVIRITLASSGAYSVTLSRAVDHPNIAIEDLREFSVPVSVFDGTVTTTNATAIQVVIEDDRPLAVSEAGSSTQPQQDVNTLFILDFSDSIDNGELDTMLGAVKSALTQLDDAATGLLGIRFVVFSSGSFASPSFATAAEANLYLDSLNPALGGERPSQELPPEGIGLNTNYTGAIQTALANFTASPTASNQVFFLSDGNPNQQIQFGGSPPRVVNSLTPATAAAWNNFVDGNDINVTAIGIDNNPPQPLNIERLRDIDLNDAPDNQPILVADFDDLVSTLLSVIVPSAVSGDLDLNDAFGADGGRILSITFGGTTYTWDGNTTISSSAGGTIAGTSLTAVATPMGASFTFDFATGHYLYQPPTPITVTATEIFSYVLTDKDGDTATANLSVTITALAPPVALDLDGDGVEFVSGAAGVKFDYDGDGTAESTAWIAPDDGLLVLDKNGNQKVDNGSEIVFAQGGLSDLQGLAASHDVNGDGKLDAADPDFANFGVWNDANSNGVTDAGEYRSLTSAGIVSISLVSDGRGYTAAGGEVIVKGEAVYTRADGSTGRVADAAFANNFANDAQRTIVSASNGISTALLAAGLVAAVPLAAKISEAPPSPTHAVSAGELSAPVQMAEPNAIQADDEPKLSPEYFTSTRPTEDFDSPATQRALSGGDDHARVKVNGLDVPTPGPDVEAHAKEMESSTGSKTALASSPMPSGDPAQVLLTVQQGGDGSAERIKAIVADAVEGRSVDLDSLLGPGQSPEQALPHVQLEGDFAAEGIASFGTILMPDMLVQQMEVAAATGHA